MKLRISIYLSAIMMVLFTQTISASVIDTAVVACTSSAAVSAYAYTVAMLFLLSAFGILLHWLVDFQKARKQNVNYEIGDYAKSTAVSSIISFVICVVVILLRHELTNKIPALSGWEGCAMFIVGYAGDSILPLVFGFAKSKGLDVDKKD